MSRDTYLHGYDISGDQYPGINAAAMSAVLGDKATALKISNEIIRKLTDYAESYWDVATLGEAYLLTGNVAQAESYYHKAVSVAGERIGDINSTYHQLLFLNGYLDIPESVIDLLAPPRVVAFSGHMIDASDRVKPRFPESVAPNVKRKLGELIDKENIGVVFCSAACGADIVFLEALLERGGRANVVLPFKEEDFIGTSVAFAGGQWEKRFRAILKRATVYRATAEGYFGGDDIYRFLGRIIIGKCLLRCAELSADPMLVTVATPGSERKAGGVIDTIEQWPQSYRRINVDPARFIDSADATFGSPCPDPDVPAKLLRKGRSLPYQVRHTIKCILFADIVGYSKIEEEQTPFFMHEIFGVISDRLTSLDQPPEIINTWGDAIFIVYERAEHIIQMAMQLRAIFIGTDWSKKGLPEDLNIRIALHAGPIFVAVDPIRDEINGYGSHINRTARIEPITLPGSIYASSEFAALLKVETGDAYQYEYVGRLELPKNAGLQDVYHISSR